ncbi:helix-turn-helix domain-containing protein [Blastopirellula retiformator]|uniref:Transposase n=1 Tax=Blastopirellula retiformator TaxID=2527970 RepID=A0A5C5UWG4_9BACT|nr:helix-turn-helix domain-containing protein [Blastopirellula retiformator]TWT30706.1 hypothetical protein Enr8_42290 [Blastopirellula retiformator]
MNGIDRRYIDHAKVLKIQRLLQAGVSMRQVADMVGVCFETVARYKAMLEEAASASEKI